MTGVNLTDPIVLESLEIAEERVRLYLKENDSTSEGKAGDGDVEIFKPESEIVVHSNSHPANEDGYGPSMADDSNCITANGEASRTIYATIYFTHFSHKVVLGKKVPHFLVLFSLCLIWPH